MICAIVLAAGRSTRMGTQKLLLPFGGKTIITQIVDQLLAGRIEKLVVVVGADAEKVTSALGERPVIIVPNPDLEAEMFSSVRCGFAAVPRECRGVLIALGDQPSITHETVAKLVAAFETGKHGIVVPLHNNHRGHPMIFSTRYRDEIMSRHDRTGLRGFLDAHDDDVLRLAVPDSSVLEDMDYPDDYRRALARLDSANS